MKPRFWSAWIAAATVIACGSNGEPNNGSTVSSNNGTVGQSNNNTTNASNNGPSSTNNATTNGGTNNGTTTGPSANWERIDTNFGLDEPYATFRLAADATNLYALLQVPDDVAQTWRVLRSTDDGESWERVHEMPGGNAVVASFFGTLGDALVLVVPAYDKAAMAISKDGGTTWVETEKIPSPGNKFVAREGDTFLATGLYTSRSFDGGATWEAIDGTSEVGHFAAVRFAAAFWALDANGARLRLVDQATAWEVDPEGPPSATDMWVADSTLWLKSSYGALFSSDDGIAWTEHPTAEADQYGLVFPAPAPTSTWLLTEEVPPALFITVDRGASVEEVTGDFPRDVNDSLCISRYVVTPDFAVAATRAALFDAAGCTPGVDPDAGVYRLPLTR